MTEGGGSPPDEVRVRRAPKYPAFLAVGAVVGIVVALIATTTREVDPEVGVLQMFLFLALFGVAAGLLFGGIAALLFDRIYSRRARTVAAERTEISAPPHHPVAEPAMETLPAKAQAEPGPDADPRREDGPEQGGDGKSPSRG